MKHNTKQPNNQWSSINDHWFNNQRTWTLGSSDCVSKFDNHVSSNCGSTINNLSNDIHVSSNYGSWRYKAMALTIKEGIESSNPVSIKKAGRQVGLKDKGIYTVGLPVIKTVLEREGITSESIKKCFAGIGAKTEHKQDFANSLRSLENLGKMLGCYQPETSVNISVFSDTMLKDLQTLSQATGEVIDVPSQAPTSPDLSNSKQQQTTENNSISKSLNPEHVISPSDDIHNSNEAKGL